MSVIFDQLRISEDGQTMFIDVHVDKASYYTNLYLDTITIQTEEYVSSTSGGVPTREFIFKGTFAEGLKEASLEITKADFDKAFLNTNSQGEPINEEDPYAVIPFNKDNLSENLFFVFIGCSGYISPDAPCGEDDPVEIGVTFDETAYHQTVMNFTKELAQDCRVPQGFIDLILLWHGFQSAIETEHFLPAIEFWKMIFKGGSDSIAAFNSKGCGCHG